MDNPVPDDFVTLVEGLLILFVYLSPVELLSLQHGRVVEASQLPDGVVVKLLLQIYVHLAGFWLVELLVRVRALFLGPPVWPPAAFSQ